MIFQPGQLFGLLYIVNDPQSGSIRDPDNSIMTATFRRNGVLSAVTESITITRLAVGEYYITGLIPEDWNNVYGQICSLKLNWEMDGLTYGHAINGNVEASIYSIISMNPWLTSELIESYRETGQPGTVAQLLYELLSLLANFQIDGLVLSTKKLDGTDTGKTYTYDANPPLGIRETS